MVAGIRQRAAAIAGWLFRPRTYAPGGERGGMEPAAHKSKSADRYLRYPPRLFPGYKALNGSPDRQMGHAGHRR